MRQTSSGRKRVYAPRCALMIDVGTKDVTLYLGERSKDGVINTTELAKHGLKAHSSFRESATELQLISRVPPWMDALMADLKKGVMLLTRGSKSGFCWPKSGRLPLMHAVLGVGSWFREMSTGDQALLTERFLNVVRDYMNTQLLDSLNVPTTKMVANDSWIPYIHQFTEYEKPTYIDYSNLFFSYWGIRVLFAYYEGVTY